ncbi:mRNA turnover protein 4 homolog [Trichonephila clavata]|uniref:Ribosome assembly factor mrt4 n=1 Tax=Trichonephila clavata TaxID=2740835 RepID=A0A8X6IK28_TRICU|nr:mRNA turnover protein 4 homolog [Trichonephila clavata]
MPNPKRNKQKTWTMIKKKWERKKEFYQEIQSCVKKYAHVFVFAATHGRNSNLRNVRMQWKTSRICVGKNKVMAKALGLTEKDERRPNLHKIGKQLKGDKGLLFTNQPIEEVVNWFHSYSEGDYARPGYIATEDVILQEGPLEQCPAKLEPSLKRLGLSTTLKDGVIYLLKDYAVCKAGEALSLESARILRLLGKQMVEFKIRLLSVWSQNGNFADLDSEN